MKKNLAGKWNSTDRKCIPDFLYLTILALLLLLYSFYTTMFSIPWPTNYEWILLIITGAIVLLKVGYSDRYTGKQWAVCAVVTAIFGLSWLSTDRIYIFLLFIPFFMIGAVDIPYKKILKVCFWVNIYTLILAMLGSFTGCIENLMYVRLPYFRYSFGMIYPTDFAARIVFLLLTAWVLYEKIPTVLMVSLSVIATIFIYYFCNARNGVVVLLLLSSGVIFERVTARYEKINFLYDFVGRIIEYLMPFLSVVMIALTLLYNENSSSIIDVNKVLNNRLLLGKNAISEYGLKLFGTAFDQIGSGRTTDYVPGYNFIDSSYILILVRYGIIVLLTILALYIFTVSKALKSNKRRLVIAMGIIAVHSLVEHHLTEINYNVFLLLPFSNLTDEEKTEERAEKKVIRKKCSLKNLSGKVYILLGGLGMLLLFLRALNILRTLVTLLRLYDPENHIKFILFISLAIVVAGAWVFTICKLWHGRKKAPLITTVTVAVVMFLLFGLKVNSIIENGRAEYAEILNQERHILEAVFDKQEVKVLVEDIPEIYNKEFGHVSCKILPFEVCPVGENIVVISSKAKDLEALTVKGYYSGEISSIHTIYTNSEKIVDILEQNGVSMGGQ